MKKSNIIFTIFGILGVLIITIGLFLPFTISITFAGAEHTAILLESFGIPCIILLVIACILGYFKHYKLVLIPTLLNAAFVGFEFYQKVNIAYDPYSDYQKMEPGIGFIIIVVGLVLIFIYSIGATNKKRVPRKKKEKQKKEASEQEVLLQRISKLQRQDPSQETMKQPAGTGNYPPEIIGKELPKEQNVIRLPGEEKNNPNTIVQPYDTTFDIVKETATSLEESHKEKEAQQETNFEDNWELNVTELNEIPLNSIPQVTKTQATIQVQPTTIQPTPKPQTQQPAAQSIQTQPTMQQPISQATQVQPVIQQTEIIEIDPIIQEQAAPMQQSTQTQTKEEVINIDDIIEE